MEGQSCGYILRMLVIITDMPMERKVLKILDDFREMCIRDSYECVYKQIDSGNAYDHLNSGRSSENGFSIVYYQLGRRNTHLEFRIGGSRLLGLSLIHI